MSDPFGQSSSDLKLKQNARGKKLPPISDSQIQNSNSIIQKQEKKQVAFKDEQVDERQPEKLELPPAHQPTMTHATYLSNPQFKTCYPSSARVSNFFSHVFTCRKTEQTFVDELNQMDQKNPKDKTPKEEQMLENMIWVLKIISTSALELDTNVVHPFVRIHIVNLLSGNYVQKSHVEENTVYNFETCCIIEQKEANKERRSYLLDIIPPFATNCCDLRTTDNSRAIWNEEIELNEEASYLYTRETLILFEILDFTPSLLKAKKFDQLDADYYHKIAWGYLRPFGLAKLYQGNIRIQLYRHIFNTKQLSSGNRRELTPFVYFDFIWPSKEPYNGVLNILLLLRPKPTFQDGKIYNYNYIWEVFEQSKSVFQIERGDKDLKKKFQSQIQEQSDEGIEKELSDQDKLNLRRRRFIGEKSQIPDQIAYKFASSPLGCYRMAFNRKGNYLAAACTYKNSKTIIKIFDVESGVHFAVFKGHRNLIHELQFSPQSQYLCSCSSDFTSKIWKVPKSSNEIIQEDESDYFLLTTLEHPSFVYSGIFLTEGQFPFVVTGCFDSRLRIWKTDVRRMLVVQDVPEQVEVISSSGNNFDVFEDLLDHRHPNTIVYDGSRRLYVGDSLGSIHVYDINTTMSSQYIANRIAYIVHPEMQGDAITCLRLVPPEMKDLLVHSRDNCIRVLEVNSNEGRQFESGQSSGAISARYFGAVTQKLCIHSTPSPCGEFVLSGSEDGKPYLWDNVSITQPTSQFQYSLIGPISDVAWNETYHMIALSGFGDEHPIIIYTWERNEDMNLMEYKELQEKLLTQISKKKGDEDLDVPVNNMNKINWISQQQQQSYQQPAVDESKPFGYDYRSQQAQSVPFSGQQQSSSYQKLSDIGAKPYQ